MVMGRAGSVEVWGHLASGDPVHRIVLEGGGLRAQVITRGASVQALYLDGHDAPLTLGFDQLDYYETHSPYFGATAGRFANRIARARFTLDGTEYRLDANDNGQCLHGGSKGFSERLWTVEETGESHVVLRLDSADGDMAFPGNPTARCRFELAGEGEFRVTLTAQTDAPTICSMAHHSYFNLEEGGAGPVTDHQMVIHANAYLPVDTLLIPVSPPARLQGTKFDFREMRRIDAVDAKASYDHNFCLEGEGMRSVAELRAPRSGVAMEVLTAEPGLQVFTAPAMEVSVPGLGGRHYGHHAGICMETQIWPDSPNQPDYPTAVLRPGERREQRTVYRFSKSA